MPFQGGDTDTNLANLQVRASSSAPGGVPVSNIVFGGAGAERTVRFTPNPGQAGHVIITLHVSDGTSTELIVPPNSPEAAALKEGALVITGTVGSGSAATPAGQRPGPRMMF